MKKMYFSGYATSGTGPDSRDRIVFQNPKGLIPGKLYLVESYTHWESRNGNGGSSYSTMETAFKVFDLKTKKLLSETEWLSVFKTAPKKKCNHVDLVYLNNKSPIQQCRDCFKKLKKIEKLVPVKQARLESK